MRLPRRLTIPGVVVISLLIALVAAALSVYRIDLLPLKLEQRQLQVAGAATHVLVDSPDSWILDERAGIGDFSGLRQRAELTATMIVSPPLLEQVSRRTGIPLDDLGATLRLTADVPFVMRDPDSEQRANDIVTSRKPYRLDIQPDKALPIVNIYAQAPTPAAAVALADTTVAALRDQVRDLAIRDGVEPRRRLHLEQLVRARGGVINGKSLPVIATLTFFVVFGVSCALLLLARRASFGWQAAARRRAGFSDSAGGPTRAPAAPVGADERAASGGDWPHTTRILPWLIAVFIAMLWLVPFNSIELTAELPFDLKFDRLVLPFLVGLWVLALAAGNPAPRIRITWIHAGVGAFVGVAFLGVVLNAQYLNQTLDLDLSTKKLVLLLSYLTLLLVVASVVRVTEVRAFLKYTLVLAVICAIGTIWEYRFKYNVFYDLSDALLPGMFTIKQPEVGLVEVGGRALTRGSADHPLEAAAMLSLALPIALVALVDAATVMRRVLYGIAACLIVAATVSTFRKTALLAPLSVGLTLAYFRRHELRRLAPLGIACVLVIPFLSPGALGSIVSQVQPDQLGAGSVNDRAADYDAVRPEVWSHLPFGRGYGSIDPPSFRVLDSDVLSRLVDTGIIGLIALIVMPLSIVLVARGIIRSRHPVWSSPALAIAAAAVSFLVVEFLFDVSSFPHAPYILMTLAAFLAVIVARDHDGELEPGEAVAAVPDEPHEQRAADAAFERSAIPVLSRG